MSKKTLSLDLRERVVAAAKQNQVDAKLQEMPRRVFGVGRCRHLSQFSNDLEALNASSDKRLGAHAIGTGDPLQRKGWRLLEQPSLDFTKSQKGPQRRDRLGAEFDGFPNHVVGPLKSDAPAHARNRVY